MIAWPKWILKSLSFITGNFRLVIEYALIATIVALCGFTAALWSSKLKTEESLAATQNALGVVSQSLNTTVGVVSDSVKKISDLSDLRRQDSKALTLLTSNLASLAKKDYEVRSRLQYLESSNEVVKQYLDAPIPPELICLLDDTCEAGDSHNSGAENLYRRDQ
jgi:hypothetical protein